MRTPAGAHKAQQNEKEQDGQVRLQGNRKQRIAQLLENIEAQLNIREMKITLADFIRLTQLERELEQEEQPREIIVTWKDPSEKHVG